MHPSSNNVGAYITSRLAMDPVLFGAGGAAPAQTAGVAYERTAVRPLHLSTKVQFPWKATLASGNTIAMAFALQHSLTDSAYADVIGASGVVNIAGIGGVSVQRGVAMLDVDLIGFKKFVKTRFTPVMSASGTDKLEVNGCFALGGGEDIPPTESAAPATAS